MKIEVKTITITCDACGVNINEYNTSLGEFKAIIEQKEELVEYSKLVVLQDLCRSCHRALGDFVNIRIRKMRNTAPMSIMTLPDWPKLEEMVSDYDKSYPNGYPDPSWKEDVADEIPDPPPLETQ